ncbi:MAG: hypothetical protein DMF34_11515 [Verrucomicrobia bacterium]|nr:MAG: hypothetical protein DMF34_11515 [Verrucomicrobiota bacterium]
MCPVCITNIALIAAGVTSSGGLTTFAVGKLYKKKQTKQIRGGQNETGRDGTQNRSEPNESSRNRVAS